MVNRTANKADLENAVLELWRYMPHEQLALEQWGRHYRVIRQDNSRPFGSNYYSAEELYNIIWFAIDALRMAGVEYVQ